jgi:phospholipid/cholesterol/gamma-HCH transport system ATP-binding protein
MPQTLIEFKNVSKAFGNKKVLAGMNLSIMKGETLTIIGGSGTGKSVTLKLLLRLIMPDEGHIFFKDQDIFEMEEEALIKMRSQIGMLFQGAALFDSLTVFENVAYPLREHFDYDEEKITAMVVEKLGVVGLSDAIQMFPADLSGGMKKRVGLARALATNPEVILYDEPTTGLDPANINRIDELILSLQKMYQVTSIAVTHDMDSAFRISNRLALLHNRRIAFVGTAQEVKNSSNSIVRDFIEGKIGGN